MTKSFSLMALLGAGLMTAGGLLVPANAFAQTITMDDAMLERCESEGLTGEVCACWFAAIAESEGLETFTEDDIDALAPSYQEELSACVEANPSE